MENDLYDLAEFLDDLEIKTLKEKESTLLKNKGKIKSFLTSNLSLKEQIEKIKKEFNIEISVFTYRNFLLKYFKKSYEDHNINKVFFNCKVKILDLILNKKYTSSTQIYEFLFNKGMLKKVKNDDNSIISYEEFISKLEEYANLKNLSLTYENNLENKTFDKVEEKPKESNNTDTIKNINTENLDSKVEIELLDGSLDSYNIRFLTYSYIFKKHSKKKYDFDEKNYIVVPSLYEGMKFDFEKIKKLIFDKNLIKDYSLIFHDNKENDGFLYIYRLINSKLHLLEKINSKESLEFEDYYKKGIITFLNVFESVLEECSNKINSKSNFLKVPNFSFF